MIVHPKNPKNIQDQGLKGFLTIKETYWKSNQISLIDGIIADIQLNISHAAEPGCVPADERLSAKHSKDFWVLTSADTQSLSRIGSITKELQ